jgi:cytochrome c-type biogenesis protein CcmH/NrfG
VEISRNDPVAGHLSWFALASAELLRRRNDAAEAAVRRALSLNPGYAWSWVLLANLLGLQGNAKDACAAFANASQAVGSAARVVDIYRKLHLTRFEQREDAARMTAGLKAVGVEI